MKPFGIEKPCSENWNEMTPTAQGAFCQKCATDVIDFTNKSNLEIKQILLQSYGRHLCGRLKHSQEDAINGEFAAWKSSSQKNIQRAFLVSLLVVFGLSIFSCSDQQDKKALVEFRKSVKEIVTKPQEKPLEISAVAPEPVAPVVLMEEMVYTSVENIVEVPEERHNYGEIDYYGYAGGIGFNTVEFEAFLIDTIPADEYDEEGNMIPKEFSALAYPNPTADFSTIELKIPVKNSFRIDLMDMNGRHISAIHSGSVERGTFRLPVDLSELPAGTYLVAIVSESYKEVVRILKL